MGLPSTILKKMYYFYILQSKLNKEIYMGSTNNLKRRVIEHNKGLELSTKKYKPWELIYYEAFLFEDLARQREQKLKQHGNTKRHLFKRIGFKHIINSAGFTLVELLVVTALILIIIGAVSQLFFGALRGAVKTTITNETRQTADYALSVMERMIRNAQTINNMTTYCEDGSSKSSISIEGQDGAETVFACPTDVSAPYLASNSARLTSSKVAVDTYPSGCSFSCTRTGSGPAVVSISFSIHQLNPSPNVTLEPEEKNNINYKTTVVVRNTGL